MRPLLASLMALLALSLVAPVATAVYQPPPICPACIPVLVIVASCAQAEANQDAFNTGDGCAAVNQEQDCVGDEVDQDAFNQGDGCAYVNSQQWSLDCRLRSIEAMLGLAEAC